MGSTARHSICYTVGMLRGWKCLLVVAVASFAFGCTSPTLPLPPPVQPSESAGTDPGTVALHGAAGTVPPGSTIIIYNLTPATAENLQDVQKVTATLVHDDGSWDATIFAIKGDPITAYDIEAGEWSEPITFTITIN
jgi:hypothetical protein